MKTKRSPRKIWSICMVLAVLILAAGLTVFNIKTKLGGSDSLLFIFIIIGILSGFVCVGAACIWVYRDCVARGDDGILWAAIVIAATPFIGILVYLLRRGEPKSNCISCGRKINRAASYCEYCGVKKEKEEDPIMDRARGNTKFMIGAVIGAVIMICSLTAVIAGAFSKEGFINTKDWNTGIITMSAQTTWDNVWSLKFKSATDGYQAGSQLKAKDNSQILYADITCGEVEEGGRLLLHIIQGETENTVDVTDLETPLEYPLTDYESGKIKVKLEIRGTKNVKSKITIK